MLTRCPKNMETMDLLALKGPGFSVGIPAKELEDSPQLVCWCSLSSCISAGMASINRWPDSRIEVCISVDFMVQNGIGVKAG